jgi:UV DNA damage endonuclease
MINLGLCCINTELRNKKPPVFCSRTCIRRTFSVEKAKQLATQNIADLETMIEWNEDHGIYCFRLTSDLFPRFTDTEVESYTIDFAKESLAEIGALIREYGHRILAHPGQYNQVGANTEKVLRSTISELKNHADIFDAMGMDNNAVLIVHGGGIYNDKAKTMDRWVDQYFQLPENVQSRLVIENCENCYSIDDVIQISKRIRERGGELPVVFDSHHYECWEINHPDQPQSHYKEFIGDVVESWGDRYIVMHISNQGSGRLGHHSDFITDFPECFQYFVNELGLDFCLEVEAKAKQEAIFDMKKKFGHLVKFM